MSDDTHYKIGFYINLVIILILIYICRNYWMFYSDQYSYEMIYYSNIEFHTGDILLMRDFQSTHNWFSGHKFSHCGAIVVVDGVPYVLEMEYSVMYFTKLEDRLKQNDGVVYYIKQLKEPLPPSVLAKVPELLQLAQQFKYPEDVCTNFIELFTQTVREKLTVAENRKELNCAVFVMWILYRLGILDADLIDSYTSIHINNWFLQLDKKYDEVRLIRFHVGKPHIVLQKYLADLTEPPVVDAKAAKMRSEKTCEFKSIRLILDR